MQLMFIGLTCYHSARLERDRTTLDAWKMTQPEMAHGCPKNQAQI